MSNTKIKAGQFSGIVGHGTDGYFLMTNGDGTMAWAEGGATGPSVTSVSYPGDDLAADPTGGQTVVLTGTNFGSSMTVSIGGTTAPSVAHDSSTQLTITTPAKAAGDYDIVVTNTVTGASGTFVNGISYNGIPTWTTAAGSLGTLESETTISTITLQATEPDGGTITFNITNGALPTGLSLTGANIDGTTTAESSTTLYSFTIEAIDDENQSTPRNFSITVNSAEITPSENFTINTYTGNGSTRSIEGKIGTAASFNGSSSIMYVNGFDTTTNFSISLWFKTSASSNQVLANNGGAEGGNIGFLWYLNSSGKIILATSSGGANFNGTPSSLSYNDGNWHNAVLNYASNGVYSIYVDNQSVVSETSSRYTGSAVAGRPFAIGAWTQLNQYWFNGLIDQVRIFNKALSSSEVTTLYGENNASSTKSTTDIFEDGSGVALYEFEEGAKDTGGGTGYIGSGGVFNGSSSRITSGLTSGLTGSYSVSAWFTQDNISTDTAHRELMSYMDANGSTGWWIGKHNNTSQWRILGVTGVSIVTMTAQAGWNHLAVVKDSSTVYVYLNGSQVTSFTFPGYWNLGNFNTPQFNIGTQYTGTAEYWDGSIDQVRIFNKAISASEVTTLYGETSASSTKSTKDIFDDGSGVALYELEENANDTGAPIDSGQSAVFNGSSSYILASSFMPTGSNPRSASAWVKTTVSNANMTILMSGTGANNNFFIFRILNGQLGLAFYANDHDYTATGLTDGNWHHVAATYDGSLAKLYLDGNLIGTSLAGTVSTNSSNFAIGAYNNGSDALFNGSIDQVRIYSSALSASDVEALASETNVPTANLVAHYKLDGNGNDETTNYNATSVNNVTYSDPAEFLTYDGTATNVSYAYDGTPTNVSFVGTSFQPDLVWIKVRSQPFHHFLFDSLRVGGGTSDYHLGSDDIAAEGTLGEPNQRVSSFNPYGFSMTGATMSNINKSTETYVAWCWKAADTTTTILVNTVGNTIASDVRANQDAGFSIVKYTGNNSYGQTVGHGLSAAPELVIIKNLNNARNWRVYAEPLGATKYINLDESAAAGTYGSFNNTAPTTTVFSTTSSVADRATNFNGDDYIAYCFHSVDGYQKVGSYSGSNSPITITTGFKPRFLMVKRTNTTGSWIIIDYAREIGSGADALFPDLTAAESSGWNTDFISTGFTISSNEAWISGSGGTYIYLAIA